MCGITGFYLNRASRITDPHIHLEKMTDILAHRGPDDRGVWFDRDSGTGLGHRRLSIIDLSEQGSQPMVSESGRYRITCNGEVYNYRELKKELEGLGHSFRGTSDTEVVLACVEQWGLYDSLARFVGMFAFALWDSAERKLFLVRDRLGIKPLYYGIINGSLVFGSELKAIYKFPGFDGKIDRNSLSLLLKYCYIPAPSTIYEGVFKLTPGTILTAFVGRGREVELGSSTFWSVKGAARQGRKEPFSGDEGEAVDMLESILKQAVSDRLVADVPVGAFLSGGIDSSLITALMQKSSDRPVRTFTVGFDEPGYDEAGYASAIAQHLGTDHTEMRVASSDALDVVPRLPALYDEPFADSSQIPTHLVSCLTRKHVKVALSGDGGDELFSGYNRYFWASDIHRSLFRYPQPARKLLSSLFRALSAPGLSWMWKGAGSIASESRKYFFENPANRFLKLSELLGADGYPGMYERLISSWQEPSPVVIGSEGALTGLSEKVDLGDFDTGIDWMMVTDMVSYLPDDILVKVDRASMGAGLEARVPMLDHRVVEFALTLPLSMKVRDGRGKWLLREVLSRHVPGELFERPKRGFEVPLGEWLRGPLREWAEDLLSEDRLKREGFFNPVQVRAKWNEHISDRRQWHYHLWNVLMFQAWLGD